MNLNFNLVVHFTLQNLITIIIGFKTIFREYETFKILGFMLRNIIMYVIYYKGLVP